MLIRAWLTSLRGPASLLLGLVLIAGLSSCDLISNRLLTKPVAQVEDRRLSAKDFSDELAGKLKNLDALSAKDPKILSVLKQQIVNDFVVNSLIDIWFKEKNIYLTKPEIEKELRSYISSYPTDSAFQESLAEAGLSYSKWAGQVESGLKKKKLALVLAQEAAPVSEEELISYYDAHKGQYEQKEAVLLSHISVEDENQSDIVKKLLKQQSFDSVAQKYSSEYGPESKDVYGWVEKDSVGGLDKAFKARSGEVFGPVRIGDRLHIFKLVEKKPFKQKTFAEARAEVLSEVVALRETARLTSWLDEQFKRYKIKKNLNMLESIRVETQ